MNIGLSRSVQGRVQVYFVVSGGTVGNQSCFGDATDQAMYTSSSHWATFKVASMVDLLQACRREDQDAKIDPPYA